MILVDTSTWVRHFRVADPRLVRLLGDLRVVTCDVVIGELALGSGMPDEAAELLGLLPSLPVPSATDTLKFIARHGPALSTSGVGWADAQILLTAVEAGALLHSADGPQRMVWRRLGFRLA